MGWAAAAIFAGIALWQWLMRRQAEALAEELKEQLLVVGWGHG